MRPLVSVVTAVYNNVAQIEHSIRSTLAQEDIELELIVVDGASTDGTLEVIDCYRDRITQIVSARDGGIYPALNRGLSLAQGDYIGFLHSDDFFAGPGALANLFAGLGGRRPAALWGDLDYVAKDAPDRPVRQWTSGPFARAALRRGWMPPHPALYVRRDVMMALEGFDTSYRISGDYDLMLRLFARDEMFDYRPGTVVRMRTGGASNRSVGNVLRKMQEDMRAMRDAGIPILPSLLGKNLGKIGQFRAILGRLGN